MNKHILSPLERARVLDYNEDKIPTPAIRNIKSRAKKNWTRIVGDMFLLATLLEKEDLALKLTDHWEAEETTRDSKELRTNEK